MLMIIDKNGNQILDESAISVAEIVTEIESHIKRQLESEREIEELRIQVSDLSKKLKEKQDLIDKWQVEEYFRVNYPDGHPNDQNQ